MGAVLERGGSRNNLRTVLMHEILKGRKEGGRKGETEGGREEGRENR